VFLKSADHKRLKSWYTTSLGFPAGAMFNWRAHGNPDKEHVTVWSSFANESDYFDPSKAPFMINYIVDDMDAILARLAKEGVTDLKREDHEYGRFAWIVDPDGNKIELWEPASQ